MIFLVNNKVVDYTGFRATFGASPFNSFLERTPFVFDYQSLETVCQSKARNIIVINFAFVLYFKVLSV